MVLTVIAFCMFLNATFIALRVIVSLNALGIGASTGEVGVLMALLSFFPIFLAMPCGRWIDSAGFIKPVVAVIVSFAAAVAVPLVFAPETYGLTPLYACCVFNGLGSMTLAITSSYIVGSFSRRESRTRNFSLLTMGNSIAGLSGPVISGYAIDWAGFPASYASAGVLTAIGTVMFLTVSSTLRAARSGTVKSHARHNAFDLLKIPELRRILLIASVVAMAWDLETFMFPVYGKAIGLSASEIGWLVGVFYAATLVVRLMQGAFAAGSNEYRSLRWCLGVTALCYALFPAFTSISPLLVLAFVLGLGLGIANPNIMSLIQSRAPEGRTGEAFGIRSMIANTTHFVLPMAYGTVLAAIGTSVLFFAFAAIAAAALPLARNGKKKDAAVENSQ